MYPCFELPGDCCSCYSRSSCQTYKSRLGRCCLFFPVLPALSRSELVRSNYQSCSTHSDRGLASGGGQSVVAPSKHFRYTLSTASRLGLSIGLLVLRLFYFFVRVMAQLLENPDHNSASAVKAHLDLDLIHPVHDAYW